MILLRKRLPTFRTNKRPLTRMIFTMCNKMPFSWKRSITLRTPKRLLPIMHLKTTSFSQKTPKYNQKLLPLNASTNDVLK